MAGAEGLEPSARGFGVDVEHRVPHINTGTVEPIGWLSDKALRLFDALLML